MHLEIEEQNRTQTIELMGTAQSSDYMMGTEQSSE